jgi:hypothetical protein
VWALAEAGKIDPDAAKIILDIVGQGGSAETIIQALKTAVENGEIPMEALQALAAFLYGAMPQKAGETPANGRQPEVKPGRAE